MSKLLMGITANDQYLQQRQATRYFAERLNLYHFNIEQKVIDAAAVVLGVSNYELQVKMNHLINLPLLHTNITDLKAKIRAAICMTNEFYLIDSLHESLNNENNKHISKLFSGNIVSGISTNEEAAYIRDCDGVMLHIINNNCAQASAIIIEDNDIVINVRNSDPLHELTLQSFAIAIAERFEPVDATETAQP